MPQTRPPCAPEFRRQVVGLVRGGRDPADLAREFEPCAQAVRNGVAQAEPGEGRREAKSEVPTAAEREERTRLRRESANSTSWTDATIQATS
jgi:transposase